MRSLKTATVSDNAGPSASVRRGRLKPSTKDADDSGYRTTCLHVDNRVPAAVSNVKQALCGARRCVKFTLSLQAKVSSSNSQVLQSSRETL